MPVPFNPRNISPEIEVERTINAAGDSENLVRRLVSEGVHSTEIHNTIQRNIDHLDIILKRQPVIDSNSPRLDDFRDAIVLGQEFIASI